MRSARTTVPVARTGEFPSIDAFEQDGPAAPRRDVRQWNKQLTTENAIRLVLSAIPGSMPKKIIRQKLDIHFPVGPVGCSFGYGVYFRERGPKMFSWLARRSYGLRFERGGAWSTFAIRTAEAELGRPLRASEADLVCQTVKRASRIRPASITGDREAVVS